MSAARYSVSVSNANGLRLLLAARKSQGHNDDEGPYVRQDHRAKTWAEREGTR